MGLIHGFDKGVMIHTCEADWLGCSISNPGQFVGLTVVYNCLADNQYGIFSDYTHLITTGQYNWWGDATGPFHPVDNPSGLGSQVSNYVKFEPWDAFGCGGFHLYLPFTAVVH